MIRHRVDAESFEYRPCCHNPHHNSFVEYATFAVVCTECGTTGQLRRRSLDGEDVYDWSRDGSAKAWMSGEPSGDDGWWVDWQVP